MQDKQFINYMMTILVILIGITALILIISKVLSDTHQEPDQAMMEAIDARIKPIGEVHLGTAPAAPTAQQTASAQDTTQGTAQNASAEMNPADVYQTACAACHAAGIANAPIYGNKAAWAPRIGNVQALYTNSLQGKGAMPAKGGRPDLSDETIKAAVDYMLEAVR